MKAHTQPIQTDTYYHIYNRGINGESIFITPDNYIYFLKKYSHCIPPIADTYAYCLLRNHFHLLVKTKPEHQILQLLSTGSNGTAEEVISRRFAALFNGYTQGFNRVFGRTGSLFDTPFRRIEIDRDKYFSRLIFYIHFNPQRHKLCSDYKAWAYSSYQTYLSLKPTQLKRKEGLDWFGGLQPFIRFHDMEATEAEQQEIFVIEYD